MKHISIISLPYDRMRYPSLGDWFYSGDTLQIVTASTDADGAPIGEREQFLVALHELVEAKLCEARGIAQDDVDRFDLGFDPMDRDAEPGDHEDAPYRNEHRFAMLVEHLMARELGLAGYGVVR